MWSFQIIVSVTQVHHYQLKRSHAYFESWLVTHLGPKCNSLKLCQSFGTYVLGLSQDHHLAVHLATWLYHHNLRYIDTKVAKNIIRTMRYVEKKTMEKIPVGTYTLTNSTFRCSQ